MEAITSFTVSYFDYRGIRVKVHHPIPDRKYSGWCYYLILHLEQFSDVKVRKNLWLPSKTWEHGSYWDQGKLPDWVRDLDWHGGITWYGKQTGSGGNRTVEIGCDFSHYWDEGRSYTFEAVIREAKNTADKLHAATQYLCRCLGDGRLVPESEIVPPGYSQSYRDEHKEVS